MGSTPFNQLQNVSTCQYATKCNKNASLWLILLELKLFIRKLSFFLASTKLNKQLVCSFSKLIRMICVILSFQIGSNLVGTCTRVVSSFCFQPIGKSFGSHISGDIIILVKKSAFNNWSYNRFKFEVSIRV